MKGRCLCGVIEFDVSGELPLIYQCHCSLCRKVSGSSSNSAMLVKAERFNWASGEERIVKFTTESGFKSEFCGHCGSPVPNKTLNDKFFWIPAGLLDNLARTNLAVHVYVDSKGSWDTSFLNDSTPKFSEMPDANEFMEMLQCK